VKYENYKYSQYAVLQPPVYVLPLSILCTEISFPSPRIVVFGQTEWYLLGSDFTWWSVTAMWKLL